MLLDSTDSALLQRLQELEAGEAELRAQLTERDRALALAAEREAALAGVLRIIRESPGEGSTFTVTLPVRCVDLEAV